MAEAELLELFEKATKAARKACDIDDNGEGTAVVDASEEARCTDALRAISAVNISSTLLLSTQVGKRLRKLTKHSSMKISKSAQEILEDWRKVVATEANASNSKNAKKPIPPPKTASAATKVQVKSTKVTQIKMVEVKVTKKIVKPEENVNAEVQKAAAVGQKVSVVSTSSTVEYAPEIGAIPKAVGDSARDRIREMLVEALAKVFKEANHEDLESAKKINVVDVAVAVENALFAKLGLSKGKEKAKYRSIMFNMKDEKNPDFRRRILLGNIKPEAVVTMTSDDMASDLRRKETEDIKAKAMFECERGVQAIASTDQFKCHKCLQRKTTYFQMQTRSADEPMTTFITCLNCNAHWKF